MLPKWSPRIPKHKIRKLYELDAKGICDDELVDDVGFTLLARCQSFIEANMAVAGKAPCPVCRNLVMHNCDKAEKLKCEACGWELTWGAYFGTIQRKQLSGAGPVIELFQDYVQGFLKGQSYQEKMYQIDRLIHGFHWHQKHGATRPVAVNLIEGRLADVVEFLDRLSYGQESTSGIQENRAEWMENSEYVRSWAYGEK
jgi:hypothetical protein